MILDQEAMLDAIGQIDRLLFGGGWFAKGQGVLYLSPTELRSQKYWRTPTAEDIAEAKQLLSDAGYPNGEGFGTVDLLGRGATGGRWQILLELEQAWLKQHLNIDSEIRLVDSATYQDELVKGNFGLNSGSSSPYEVPAPEYYIKNAFGQCGDTLCAKIFAFYNNPELDALLRTLELESDSEKRYALSVELSDWLTEEMPGIPLYTGQVLHHFYYDHVKGMMPDGSVFAGGYIANKHDYIWLDR